MKRVMLMTWTAIAVAAAAGAQQPQVFSYTFEHRSTGDAAPQIQLDKMKLDVAYAVETKVTTNAPYSGEATSESVQQLADGNRIVRRSTTRVYRDAAGRVRREMLGPDGQMVNVVINDPTSGVSYFYEPDSKVASKSTTRTIVSTSGGQTVAHSGATAVFVGPVTGAASEEVKAKRELEIRAAMAGASGQDKVAQLTWVAEGRPAGQDVTREDLGQQTIEGVLATGTRTTIVIPAGQVGNEQPIKIVSEEWYSPELQVLVLTKHSDPRVGDTTYRLTNVSRTEPDRSLFELPAGVTVREPSGVATHFEIKK